jgi:hypothetical protein
LPFFEGDKVKTTSWGIAEIEMNVLISGSFYLLG